MRDVFEVLTTSWAYLAIICFTFLIFSNLLLRLFTISRKFEAGFEIFDAFLGESFKDSTGLSVLNG